MCTMYQQTKIAPVKTAKSEHSPTIVAPHAPDSDAHNGLRVQNCAVHGVNQVQHVIFQYKVHVFALQFQRKYNYTVHHPLKLSKCYVCAVQTSFIFTQSFGLFQEQMKKTSCEKDLRCYFATVFLNNPNDKRL